MMKNIFFLLVAIIFVVGFQANARPGRPHYPPPYASPYPPPYPPSYPVPYPPPYPYQVTCYTQGLANGAVFYGVGPDYYTANNWAFYACQSTGQYCQSLGCR